MLKKEKFKSEMKKCFYFMFGNVFYAVAIRIFLVGNNIAAGGFSGIAIVLSSVLPITLATFIFLMNVPFLIIAAFVKGKAYAVKTLIAAFSYSLTIQLIWFLPTVTTNKLVAAVFGGLLYGVGSVFLMKSEASGGGTDLIARLLRVKFKSLTMGRISIVVDGVVILFAMIAFKDIEAGLYAVITIYVRSIVNDSIISGFDKANMCHIITHNDPVELAKVIQKQLGRSVTLQNGTGMYSGSQQNILMTVIRPRETWQLKEIVESMDPDAFLVMASANEVIGRGFKKICEETPPDALELSAIVKHHKKEKEN